MTGLGDILVLGLGVSGTAVCRYLSALVASGEARSVVAVDAGDGEALQRIAEELESIGVTVLLGADRVDGHYDVCVASPGVPPHSPLMVSARAACRELISEVEFAYRRSSHAWVAITGTNGKTTTTALVTHLLNHARIPARSVGNIGAPAIIAVGETSAEEVLVAEMSSFQLASTVDFHPRVAVLLNITPDHIDWHGSMEAYAADKAKVFANLGASDTAVIDIDDPGSAPYAQPLEHRGVDVVRVSREQALPGGASVSDGWLTLETRAGRIRLLPADELRILGAHNVSNALAAASAVHALGVSPVSITEGLRSFSPIEHRLEPSGVVAGVEWFNDSKATNPDAVFKALSAFADRPVIVLLGGRNKGNDFRPLAEEVARTAKAAVAFGESAPEFHAAFRGLDVPFETSPTMAEAMMVSRGLAEPGDAVLLSPACASFDEFDGYEHRGDVFKSLVRAMGGAT